MRLALSLALLTACSYTAPDPQQGDDDVEPDAMPGGDGNVTPTDGPSSDGPATDGPIAMADCGTGYAPIAGGSPATATYRGFNNKVTWTTARTTCTNAGADLVVIDNAAEAAATTALVVDSNGSDYHWVGLRDNPGTGTDNDFISVRGGAPTYAPWGSSQPNGADQDCVLLSDQGAPHELFDYECGAPQVFVCECL